MSKNSPKNKARKSRFSDKPLSEHEKEQIAAVQKDFEKSMAPYTEQTNQFTEKISRLSAATTIASANIKIPEGSFQKMIKDAEAARSAAMAVYQTDSFRSMVTAANKSREDFLKMLKTAAPSLIMIPFHETIAQIIKNNKTALEALRPSLDTPSLYIAIEATNTLQRKTDYPIINVAEPISQQKEIDSKSITEDDVLAILSPLKSMITSDRDENTEKLDRIQVSLEILQETIQVMGVANVMVYCKTCNTVLGRVQYTTSCIVLCTSCQKNRKIPSDNVRMVPVTNTERKK